MSETVARTGWPCSPNTSQNVTGQPPDRRLGSPSRVQPLLELRRRASPACAMPARSPFTSAMNTGTPMREKPSASTCSVTVLPVPVAPVISAVAVREGGEQRDIGFIEAGDDDRFGHGRVSRDVAGAGRQV